MQSALTGLDTEIAEFHQSRACTEDVALASWNFGHVNSPRASSLAHISFHSRKEKCCGESETSVTIEDSVLGWQEKEVAGLKAHLTIALRPESVSM